jgi:hypothetical protein
VLRSRLRGQIRGQIRGFQGVVGVFPFTLAFGAAERAGVRNPRWTEGSMVYRQDPDIQSRSIRALGY